MPLDGGRCGVVRLGVVWAAVLVSSAALIGTTPRLPAPMPPVVRASCPDLPGSGCVWPDGTVYAPAGDRFALLHELGHVAARQSVDPGEQNAFMRRVGAPVWVRPSGAMARDTGDEQFADAYAHCRMHDLPRGRLVHGARRASWQTSTDYMPRTNERHLSTCRFIVRALAD